LMIVFLMKKMPQLKLTTTFSLCDIIPQCKLDRRKLINPLFLEEN
jgi:hypothetical protein